MIKVCQWPLGSARTTVSLGQCHGRKGLTRMPSLVSYIMSKGSIVGPAWKMPFIGPFLQSMDPKFEEYYAKWASGPLSCVSVFHK